MPLDCWNGVGVSGAELVPTEKALACPSGDGDRDVLFILLSKIDWGSWSVERRRRPWPFWLLWVFWFISPQEAAGAENPLSLGMELEPS